MEITINQLVSEIEKWWRSSKAKNPDAFAANTSKVETEIRTLANTLLLKLTPPDRLPKPENLPVVKTEDIDIGAKITKVLDEIGKNFNGVWVQIRREATESWNANYAIFYLNDYDRGFGGRNDYEGFNHDDFQLDFYQHFKKAIAGDPTVIMNYNSSCNEYEFYRKAVPANNDTVSTNGDK